ncbi:MAG: hypothetical protein ABEI32_14140 [Halothece sp.]
MERKQINFKIPSHLLERVRRQAKIRGESYTNYIIEAIRMRLGADLEKAQGSLGDQDQDERLSRLENRIASLSDIVDYATYSIEKDDESISKIVDALEAIRDQFEIMGWEVQDPLDDALDNLNKNLGKIEASENETNQGD